MCRHRSPLFHKLCRVPAMRLGLLVRKPSLRPSRVVAPTGRTDPPAGTPATAGSTASPAVVPDIAAAGAGALSFMHFQLLPDGIENV